MSEKRVFVRFAREGHTGIITIDRPEARNAINGGVASGIEAAIDEIENDPDLWLGIICANGPAFCAGADLKEVSEGKGAALGTERGGFAGVVTRKRTKPLIAAVDGPALAGGCEVVLACDLIVASAAARFGIPEVKRGLIAGAGGLFKLGRHLPLNVAMELSLTGDPMDAATAKHWGLVNILTAPGEALAAALDLAARINANAPISVRYSRQVVLETMHMQDEEAFSFSIQKFQENLACEDAAEGPRAFVEKRAPAWKGR